MRICAVAIAQVEVLVQSCAGVIYFNMQQTYTYMLHKDRDINFTENQEWSLTMKRDELSCKCHVGVFVYNQEIV